MSNIKDAVSIQLCWSITPLGIGGNFTSPWEMAKLWPLEFHFTALGLPPATTPYFADKIRIRGHAWATAASAVNGLIIEQSLNGVIPHVQAFFTVPAGGFIAFDVLCFSKYVRINYTNGAVAQVAFALVAYLAEPGG